MANDDYTFFVDNQLEYLLNRLYELLQAPLKAFELFPVSNEIPEGSETFSYEIFEKTGMAKLIANYADDLPLADVATKKVVGYIRSIGSAFTYSTKDIRAARIAGKDLQARKMDAVSQAHRQLWNKIAFEGDAEFNLPGLFTNDNIPVTVAALNAGGGSRKWEDKTQLERLADLDDLVTSIVNLTNGVEEPDTIVMPVEHRRMLFGSPLQSGSDTSAGQWYLDNHDMIKNIVAANEFKDAASKVDGAYTDSVIFAYKKAPEKLEFQMPMMMKAYEPQEDNLSYKVPTESETGGLVIYKPLSCRFLVDV